MTARYRRLPGHRRGIIKSASVWLGTDHLLAVRGTRFREEYKRFHLADIQAISVARAPRFHISTRSIGIAVLLFFAYFFIRGRAAFALPAYWGLCALLVIAWASISAWASCRCRIYTAVSDDELPSLYRIWTARRFLARVQPPIAAAQGAVDGAWTEAARQHPIGPEAVTSSDPLPAAPAGLIYSGDDATPLTQRTKAKAADLTPVRTLLGDLYLASLAAGALVSLLAIYWRFAAFEWLYPLCALLELAGSVAVIIARARHRVRAPMQRLAIAGLVVVGAGYYVSTFVAAFAAGAQGRSTVMPTIEPSLIQTNSVFLTVHAGALLVLTVIGVVIAVFADKPPAAPGEP